MDEDPIRGRLKFNFVPAGFKVCGGEFTLLVEPEEVDCCILLDEEFVKFAGVSIKGPLNPGTFRAYVRPKACKVANCLMKNEYGN
jgi:hypothetical protein